MLLIYLEVGDQGPVLPPQLHPESCLNDMWRFQLSIGAALDGDLQHVPYILGMLWG